MSFGEAVRTCFRKYATFTGRAGRSEYWWWVLFYVLVIFAVGLVGSPGDAASDGLYGLLGIVWLALFIPTLAVFVRRLHDTNRSGWWWFIGLIPFVGSIVLLVFVLEAGSPGPNKYGPPPIVAISDSTA